MEDRKRDEKRPLLDKKSDIERNTQKSKKSKKKTKPELEEIDYKFLDGLRGIGALAVYFYHFYVFFPEGGPHYTDGKTDPEWITNFKATPFTVFVHAYFWVVVFFILSGFVLPLKWYKTR